MTARKTKSYTTTPAPKRKPNTRGGKRRASSGDCPTLDASKGPVTLGDTYRPTRKEIADGDD